MNIGRADISAFEADEMARRAYSQGWKDGKYTALDAAREAVERVSSLLQPLGPALAAIDALKEKP